MAKVKIMIMIMVMAADTAFRLTGWKDGKMGRWRWEHGEMPSSMHGEIHVRRSFTVSSKHVLNYVVLWRVELR